VTVDYNFELTEMDIPSPHLEILYFTTLELINNVLKHAHAKNLKIELKELENEYVLFVEDDGVGYDSEELNAAGIGLRSIRQRAEFLNSSFVVQSLSKGTKHLFRIEKKQK